MATSVMTPVTITIIPVESVQTITMTGISTPMNGIVADLILNSASPCRLLNGAVGPGPRTEKLEFKGCMGNGMFAGCKAFFELYQSTVRGLKSYA